MIIRLWVQTPLPLYCAESLRMTICSPSSFLPRWKKKLLTCKQYAGEVKQTCAEGLGHSLLQYSEDRRDLLALVILKIRGIFIWGHVVACFIWYNCLPHWSHRNFVLLLLVKFSGHRPRKSQQLIMDYSPFYTACYLLRGMLPNACSNFATTCLRACLIVHKTLQQF